MAPTASLNLRGANKTTGVMRALAKRMRAAAKQALRIEAESIMTDSKQNYVPVDLGTLRGSGYVGDVKAVADHDENGRFVSSYTVDMGYGGAASAYALAVHEHPSEHSPASWKGVEVKFSPEGHGPKYLERPVKAASEGMPERVAERLRKALPPAGDGGGDSGGEGNP